MTLWSELLRGGLAPSVPACLMVQSHFSRMLAFLVLPFACRWNPGRLFALFVCSLCFLYVAVAEALQYQHSSLGFILRVVTEAVSNMTGCSGGVSIWWDANSAHKYQNQFTALSCTDTKSDLLRWSVWYKGRRGVRRAHTPGEGAPVLVDAGCDTPQQVDLLSVSTFVIQNMLVNFSWGYRLRLLL